MHNTSALSTVYGGLSRVQAHLLPLQKTKWHGHELTATLRRNVVVSPAAKANKKTPMVGEAAVAGQSLGLARGRDHEPSAVENHCHS